MKKKERKKKIFEELRAEQPQFDDLTRRLRERLEQHRRQAEGRRREAS
jgi:hypothetical protein